MIKFNCQQILIISLAILSLGQAQIEYEAFNVISELNVFAVSNDSQYGMFVMNPNFYNSTMIDAFYDFKEEQFFFPNDQIESLGCDRKLHVTNWGYIYCVDDTANYLYQLSVEQPYQIVNQWWLGYSDDTSYYDWSDLATQYLVFCDLYSDSSELYEVVNFTIFNMETQEWVVSYAFSPQNLSGPTYYISGYFIAPEFQGWAVMDENSDLGVQYWMYNFTTQTYSQFAQADFAIIQRTITMNYSTVIEFNNNIIYTVNVASGDITQNQIADDVLFTEKINDTYFSLTAGTSVNLYTATYNSTLLHMAQFDASYFLTSNNLSFFAPICCPQNGYLQVFIQQQFQNSYLILNADNLEFEDYVVSYPYAIEGGVYFPPFILGNGSVITPDLGGYRISDKNNKFLAYVNLPLQDVYIDYSENYMVYGLYTGSSQSYNGTDCYLLVVNASTNHFKTVSLSSCPNADQENVNLLDVQPSGNSYNVVYQTSAGFVVIQSGTVYNVNSLVAQFGTSTVYPFYNTNSIYILSQIKTGQLVLEDYQITSGARLSTQVVALYGIAQKVSSTSAIYVSKSLTSSSSTINVYRINNQTVLYSNPVQTSVVSITPTSCDLGSSHLVKGYVYVDSAQNVWAVDTLLSQTQQVNFTNYGQFQVNGVGNGNFALTTYNSAMQQTTIFKLDQLM